MCNLYRLRSAAAEVAHHFSASLTALPNVGEEVYPGASGLVVIEADGARELKSMVWGFPLPQKSKKTGLPIKPKPVNNIANLDSFMWRHIAPRPANRCLIPATEFAEAEGERGAKTRTWFSVRDEPVFAWAGMWRDSDEWGPVYSGLMTDANAAVAPVHDRMPVILHAADHAAWMHGDIDDVRKFQARVLPAEAIVVDRTGESWLRRGQH